MEIETRFADSDDMEWIISECAEFSKSYNSKFSIMGNIQYARTFIANLIDNHVVIIAEMNKEKMGFIAGMKQPHHFNPDLMVLSELLWWVPVRHRGSKAGSALLKDFLAFGDEMCDLITFTLEETTPISDEALIKRGFKLTEKAYLREVDKWQR